MITCLFDPCCQHDLNFQCLAIWIHICISCWFNDTPAGVESGKKDCNLQWEEFQSRSSLSNTLCIICIFIGIVKQTAKQGDPTKNKKRCLRARWCARLPPPCWDSDKLRPSPSALHFAPSYIALHCIALHCIAFYCIALHCIALHCSTCGELLPCIEANYIAREWCMHCIHVWLHSFNCAFLQKQECIYMAVKSIKGIVFIRRPRIKIMLQILLPRSHKW